MPDRVKHGQDARHLVSAEAVAGWATGAGEDLRYVRIALARCAELLIPFPRVFMGYRSFPVTSDNASDCGIIPIGRLLP